MANSPVKAVRLDPALLEAVRVRHGLNGVAVSSLIRWALAYAGGHADPAAVAFVPMGPTRDRVAA